MKLSGLQIFGLVFVFQAGNMILLTIGPVMKEARQDGWISYVLAGIAGVLIVYAAARTALLYPGKTLIEFSRSSVGKIPGTLIALTYLVQWYAVNGNILRQFADFTISQLLPKTPSWALFITLLLLIMYVNAAGGAEGIGRCAEVFGPIILVSMIILAVLTAEDYRFEHLLPVFYETDTLSILKGALIPLSFFAESVWILMLVSMMDTPQKAIKSAVWGMVFSVGAVLVTAVSVLLVLGPELSGKLRHPVFDVVSYIFVLDFIQNLSIVAIYVWILSIFIKSALYFFLACYGTAQLFGMKNWKIMIWIAAAFFFALAQFYPDITYTFGYMHNYLAYVFLPLNAVGIPLLLWIVGTIRQRKNAG